MREVRPDLEAERAKASTKKMPMTMMENSERLELMDVLLRISSISQEAFDILDSQSISEADVFLILQLPDWCNAFTKGMEDYARMKVDAADRRDRQRTSYRGTNKGR